MFWIKHLNSRQIRNLIRIVTTNAHKLELQEELARREKERRALFVHQQRGRDRAKAEGRLR